MIDKVLSTAVQLWLRSQVEQAEILQVSLTGGDRQILTGYIPQVELAGCGAIYRGLYLGKVSLTGSNIRVNLAQILKGKPLRLLEPVPVTGEIEWSEADLQASLDSALLSAALAELTLDLLSANEIRPQLEPNCLSWQAVKLDRSCLTLKGIISRQQQIYPLIIQTLVKLTNSHTLCFQPLYVEINSKSVLNRDRSFQIDLGTEVELTKLSLTANELVCRGRLIVRP